MSSIEPGRRTFWGASDGAVWTRLTGAAAAAVTAGAATPVAWAFPKAISKNAFWAAVRAASWDGPASGVGGRALGRIGVTGRSIMVNGQGWQPARPASTQG